MPVVGAVLSLAEEGPQRQQALEFLARHPAITVGQPQAQGLPVVVESSSQTEDREIWKALEAEPGILFLALVYADFSDLTLEEA